MIGHKAISPYGRVGLSTSLDQVIEVCIVVFGAKKRLLSPVPTLSYVVRDMWDDDS